MKPIELGPLPKSAKVIFNFWFPDGDLRVDMAAVALANGWTIDVSWSRGRYWITLFGKVWEEQRTVRWARTQKKALKIIRQIAFEQEGQLS